MLPKPSHLTRRYAEQFQDQRVVDAYNCRPLYPDGVFSLLVDLMDARCRCVLDVGCGTGEIARRLAPLVDQVDAVDFSPAMIARGRSLPGGEYPGLRWICGAVEEVELSPPYGLITAAASLHWMDWERVLPRFREVLTESGCLAIIENGWEPVPCPDGLWDLVCRYSTNQEYQPYDLIEELERRHLFQKQGEQALEPVLYTQSVEAYIDSAHARNGFSRDRMAPEAASAFDSELREMLLTVFPDGQVHLSTSAQVIWGQPPPYRPSTRGYGIK